MSDVQLPWTTGKTVDAFVLNGSDQWYRTDTHVFEAYNAANFNVYKTQLTEQGASGIYIGTLPTTGVAAGTYNIHARERQSGSAAPSDPVVGGPAGLDYDGAVWHPQEDTIDISLAAISGQVGNVQSTQTTMSATLDITVNHNYGGVDNYRILLTGTNAPVDNATIRAYVQADYDAGTIDASPPTTMTGSDGRWVDPLMLDADTYLLTVYNPATKLAKNFRNVVVA